MTSHLRARRVASALLLCAVAAPALADGEAAAATAAPPQQATRRPPPMVLVIPLGFGALLPLTLPTTTPRTRHAPATERQDGAPPEPQPARSDAPPQGTRP